MQAPSLHGRATTQRQQAHVTRRKQPYAGPSAAQCRAAGVNPRGRGNRANDREA